MARPRKTRTVTGLPRFTYFSPDRGDLSDRIGTVIVSVDEFEVMKLIDYRNLTQEEAAEQMGIGRTTVQFIYREGRRKIADALVNGKNIKIRGGNYVICNAGHNMGRRCRYREGGETDEIFTVSERILPEKKKEITERVAIPFTEESENEIVYPRFGQSDRFVFYDLKDNLTVSAHRLTTGVIGPHNLIELLKDIKTDVLLCGRIGPGAMNGLKEARIPFYDGYVGKTEDALKDYLEKKMDTKHES